MRIVDVLAVPVQAGFFMDDQLAIRAAAGHDETDRSAQVTAHVAMACQAAQVLAKPGMGVDEGLMIVANEMARTAALVRAREAAHP
ncbi:MAG TPA: hypothetical protein VHT26_02715 [Trebonia sp.]|nr:hypothetical protein [Trebonia sp.]